MSARLELAAKSAYNEHGECGRPLNQCRSIANVVMPVSLKDVVEKVAKQVNNYTLGWDVVVNYSYVSWQVVGSNHAETSS